MWFAVLLAGLLTVVPVSAVEYNITALGGSSAHDINNAGQIVGQNGPYAFLWQNGIMQNLGTLPGGMDSYAFGINDSGQVVGNATTSPSTTHAFLWQGGIMQDLGTLPGNTNSAAKGINNAGQVAGVTLDGSGSKAFLWQGGVMQDLGSLGGTFSSASAINASGQVAGSSGSRAVLWQGGTVQNLGTVPGGLGSSGATSINNHGQVVGNWLTGTGGTGAFLWQGGIMQDLGTFPGGNYSIATDINNAGQVVGMSSGGSVSGSYLWQGGSMQNLSNLLLNGSNWSGLNAFAINDAGWIVGGGYYYGSSTAFLMTPEGDTISSYIPPSGGAPVPEPASLLLFGSGLAGLAARRRRA